jgi:hypothetical protein
MDEYQNKRVAEFDGCKCMKRKNEDFEGMSSRMGIVGNTPAVSSGSRKREGTGV